MRTLKFFSILLVIFFSLIFFNNVSANTETDYFCSVYFTGVGCPHCANTDPFVLDNYLKKIKNLIVIEYEIYQTKSNAPLIQSYNTKYNSPLGIPLIIFDKKDYIIGDQPILDNLLKKIKTKKINICPILAENNLSFEKLDLNQLPGSPKIWRANRVLIRTEKEGDSVLAKKLLINENLSDLLKDKKFEEIKPLKIPLSGSFLNFENAIKIKGWIFQWNGKDLSELKQTPSISEMITPSPSPSPSVSSSPKNYNLTNEKTLTIGKIVSLSIVDSVNPCALAVLTLVLLAILTYNPEKRKDVLLAGGAFILSVFIMYFFYGLVIIRFFKVVQALTTVKLYLYKILGAIAMILGILQMKDFFRYKPGGFLTEMPLFLRPKAKKIISGITSPKGAFFIGLFVTLFLLPCTIGPYVVAGGILSFYETLKTIPWLLLYNLIFVLPMVVIVLLIYLGTAKIEDVSNWKERNIRYLHLIAGLLCFFIGLGMLLGKI